MQSPPADTPPDGSQGKSRLDRELEEILSKNENIRLLPPPPKATKTKPSIPAAPSSLTTTFPKVLGRIASAPILVALILGIVAYLISDLSQLIANLLCVAAVVCIILPMVQRFRRPAPEPQTRMWRGQTFEVREESSSNLLDSLRTWWNSRHR
jgi:hypothetical protein